MIGWAEYRRGNWRACIEALEKSRPDYPRDVDFPRAVAYWQFGDRDKARREFDLADRMLRDYEKDYKIGQTLPDPQTLRRLRAEAAAVLGLDVEPQTSSKSQTSEAGTQPR